VSPLSLLTFFAAAKKVSAAPHRGNARAAQAPRGCQRKRARKNSRKNRTPPKANTIRHTQNTLGFIPAQKTGKKACPNSGL
jgi:general secretion pathway protein K